MLIVIKSFLAAALTISIPILASWFALSGIPRWSKAVDAKQKTLLVLRQTFERAGSGRISIAVVAALIIQCICFYQWRHATDIESGIESLFIMAFIGVAITFYSVYLVFPDSSLLSCPGCQWLWGLLVVMAIWFGRARTQTDLANIFGAVSDKLPAAMNVGIFLRAFGHISLIMASITAAAQILLMAFVFGLEKLSGDAAQGGDKRFSRGWIAVFNTLVIIFSSALSGSAAQVLGFSSEPIMASVARVAADTDLLRESTCTGNPKDLQRRIVFRSDEREQAVVFQLPDDMLRRQHANVIPRSAQLSVTPPANPLVQWTDADYARQIPKMVAIDKECALVSP